MALDARIKKALAARDLGAPSAVFVYSLPDGKEFVLLVSYVWFANSSGASEIKSWKRTGMGLLPSGMLRRRNPSWADARKQFPIDQWKWRFVGLYEKRPEAIAAIADIVSTTGAEVAI